MQQSSDLPAAQVLVLTVSPSRARKPIKTPTSLLFCVDKLRSPARAIVWISLIGLPIPPLSYIVDVLRSSFKWAEATMQLLPQPLRRQHASVDANARST